MSGAERRNFRIQVKPDRESNNREESKRCNCGNAVSFFLLSVTQRGGGGCWKIKIRKHKGGSSQKAEYFYKLCYGCIYGLACE